MGGTNYEISFFRTYPHLFTELKWYEEREALDMPEYVKRIDETEFFEVASGYNGSGSIIVKYPKGKYGTGTAGPIGLMNLLPATETDYNEYLKTKKA